ncbi:MAG: hypothetical protein R2694_20440 [Ilumatobacteraceae bacterium]
MGRRPRRATVLTIATVLAVVAVPLRGLFLSTGSSMEEGFMIVFPMRVLAGDVPNVDFLHLYGPFSLHVLAGWYWLLGDTLEVERVFGLLQHLALIFGLFALARAWGRKVAVVAAVTATLLVLTPIGLSALAWEGGVAFALWSVVAGLRAMHTEGRVRTRALVAAGVLAGFALGYRPDLALALGLVHGWLLWRARGSAAWRTASIGVLVGLLPMFVHLAVAGIGPSMRGMFLEPVFDLRPGRELPSPPSFGRIDGALQAVAEGPLDAPWWQVPHLSANHQLFLWFFVVVGVAIALPIVAHRRWRQAGRPMGRRFVLARRRCSASACSRRRCSDRTAPTWLGVRACRSRSSPAWWRTSLRTARCASGCGHGAWPRPPSPPRCWWSTRSSPTATTCCRPASPWATSRAGSRSAAATGASTSATRRCRPPARR